MFWGKVVFAAAFLAASAAAATPAGQAVSFHYEIGQELGFGASDESYVTSDMVARLRREASAGKKDAQYYLGVVLYYGDSVGKDVPAALAHFRAAAAQGHVNSMVNLGVVHFQRLQLQAHAPSGAGAGAGEEGTGEREREVDRQAAVEWLSRAAGHRDANAQWMLGKMHYDALVGKAPDMFEAMRLFHESAKQGNANGQFYVGLLSEYGYGTPRSASEAAKWYRLAVEQKHPEAMYNLGLMYAYDRGVGKDYLRAAMLFEQACHLRNGPGCLMLGTMNVYGNGFPVDYDAALVWMQKAVRTGDTRVNQQAAKAVSELTSLLSRANKYFDEAPAGTTVPGRLPNVRLPSSPEEVEAGRKIARAVGDAQARARVQVPVPAARHPPPPQPDSSL